MALLQWKPSNWSMQRIWHRPRSKGVSKSSFSFWCRCWCEARQGASYACARRGGANQHCAIMFKQPVEHTWITSRKWQQYLSPWNSPANEICDLRSFCRQGIAWYHYDIQFQQMCQMLILHWDKQHTVKKAQFALIMSFHSLLPFMTVLCSVKWT